MYIHENGEWYGYSVRICVRLDVAEEHDVKGEESRQTGERHGADVDVAVDVAVCVAVCEGGEEDMMRGGVRVRDHATDGDRSV